jgi:hypothetical protein
MATPPTQAAALGVTNPRPPASPPFVGGGPKGGGTGYPTSWGPGGPGGGMDGGGQLPARMGGLGQSPIGPTSDPRMVAQFWPSAKINPDSLPFGTNGAWKSFEVDRPTICVVSQGIIVDQFFYCPERIGDCNTVTGGVSVPAASTNTVRGDQALFATRHGCCYFSAPGKWWVYNPSNSINYQVWLIDASDASVAQRYLNESASCLVSNSTNVTVATTTTLLVNANRARSATIIQHTGRDAADAATTNDVFLGFEASAVLGQGMILLANQTIALTGETNYRSRIRAIARTGQVKVAVSEFFS